MENSIILGDCINEIKKMKDESVNLILIDPPYQISKSSNFDKISKNTKDIIKKKYSKVSIDFGDWDHEEIDFDLLFKEYYRVLKKGGTLISFYDVWKSGILKELAIKNKFKQPRVGVWIKCIAGSSEIYVRNLNLEYKKMRLKDIYRNGNFTNLQVWNGDKWTNINDVIKSDGKEKNLKIELNSGEEIKSSKEHIFVLVDGSEVKASDLKIGDTLKSCNLPDSELDKSKMMSDNLAWFIGLYLAEGSMSNKKMQISSNINEIDRIDRIGKLCQEYDGKFHVFNKTNTKCMSINVSSIIIQSYLEKYLSGRLSYDKKFSNDFWNLPNRILEIVFLSYLEADAYYDSKNMRYKLGFTGKNRGLERDIRTICSRLNYRCSMRLGRVLNTKTGKKHSVIRGSVYMNRNSKIKKNLFSIKNITELNNEKTNYFDIVLLDESHLFSLYSGVLVHNCNPTPINSKSNYLSNAHEFFFTFVKDKKPTFNSEYDNAIYRYPLCHGKERTCHPTQKPLSLIKQMIEKHSNPGDLVLDTFSGSGTLAEACLLTDRRFLCIEKDEKYYQMSLDRIKQLDINKI